MNQVKNERQGLQNRHIQLIAIAGTIGTGLFLGSGKTISKTGPSIIIAYIIIGFVMFIFLRTIGEMLYHDPTQHSFLNFITKFVGPRTGYFAQWSYWIVLVFLCISELTAVGLYIQFWLHATPLWLIEMICLLLLFALNTLSARVFGETEFWFSIIKVAAILGLIITSIILAFGNFSYSSIVGTETIQSTVSINNILKDFKMFPHGIGNFFGALQMVMFAFTSMEFIGMTAAETEKPEEVLPKAINQIPIRILIFYVGALLAIMTIFDWHSLPADQSPFVMVFKLIGIKWAAALVNFVVLTSAASALNSSLFSATRNMYALAKQHKQGHLTIFTKQSKTGIPLNALLLAVGFTLFAPLLTLIPQIKNAFDFAASCTTNLFLIVYLITIYTFWKYRKSSEFDPNGFLTPKAYLTIPCVVIAFLTVFISLFFNSETLYPAFGAIVWTLAFGGFSYFKKL